MAGESDLSTETCSKCGREARGRSYHFYYGHPAERTIGYGDSLDAETTKTTTTYEIDGSDSLFVCSHCVRRRNRARDIAMTVIGLWLGIIVLGVGIEKSWWNPGLFYSVFGVFLLLLGIGGVISMFSADVDVDDGEALAVKLVRERRLHDAETYWTATEYKKLRDQEL